MDENSKVMGERNSPTLLKPTPHICGVFGLISKSLKDIIYPLYELLKIN